MQGIQKVVFDIIKTSCDLGNAYITKPTIKVEAMKTSLAELDKEFTNTKRNIKRKIEIKKTKLDATLDQALRELKEKGVIKQTKRGHWRIVKNATKYPPVICKALKKQYEIYCPKCNKYTYKITDKPKIEKKCPDCGKRLQVQFYKYQCPIRNMFIGDPVKQCELIHGTDLDNLSIEVFPMKICYFSAKPTQITLEYAKQKVKKEEEKKSKDVRYYNSDVRDPLSKHYLPKLAKED